jgi:hypothetical protein
MLGNVPTRAGVPWGPPSPQALIRTFRSIVAVSVAACGLAVVPAALADHPLPAGAGGLSEAELRASEAELLGLRHAAEHARQRDATRPPADFMSSLRSGTLGQTGSLSESEHLSTEVAEDDPRAQDGAWSAPFQLPLYAIHAAMLPTGKVMFFGPPGPRSTTNWTHAVLWDPATGQQELVNPPLAPDPMDGDKMKPANVYCSGQAFLADGQLLLAGGTLDRDSSGRARGLKKIYSFNPFDKTWTEQPDMAEGRWYPSQVLLPDGRQVIISGDKVFTAEHTDTIEIFNPAPERNQQGTLAKLAGVRGEAGQPPTSGLDLYPHLFTMPSGRTLVAGPAKEDSWFLNNPGGDGSAISWSDLPDTFVQRTYGNAVLLPPPPGDTAPSTKVMQIGGFPRATSPAAGDSSETLDESDSTPSWEYDNDALVHDRAHQNTVLLPDGSMVAVGGGTGEVPNLFGTRSDGEHKKVELYDPLTQEWRLGAAQVEDRAYHSVAVLLPDGRVISAGDDGNSKSITGALDTAEVYEPPYLFKGPRPTVSWAPSATSWGRSFGVSTPNTDISRAVLIAPGATTHAADMHQRYVPLELTRRAGGVDLKAPANANVAPPGYYMLFLVNEAGVPSIAKFVRLMPNAPVETDPSQDPGSTQDPGSSQDQGSLGGTAATPIDPVGTADLLAPRIESLTLGSTRLRAAAAARGSASAAPARTRVSYRLSEASTARFTLQRAVRPRRYRRVRGSISRAAAQGLNRLVLRARFGGRNLRPGSYRLALVATDAAGNRSRAKRVAFRVVAR